MKNDIEDMLRQWNPPAHKSTAQFVSEVMQKVHTLPTPQPWWKSLFAVSTLTVQLRPVALVAIVFVLGLGIGYWMNHSPNQTPAVAITETPEKPQGEKEFVVKFVYMDPSAQSVQVMGDFSHWQKIPMSKRGGGLWTITVPLTEGMYNYQFVIDGKRFVTDPTAPEEADDGFGQTDSVLSL